MKRLAAHRLFVFTFLLLSLDLPLASSQPAPPKGLDAYIEKVQKEFEVPGISLAIVKDGKVVLAKGYGVRKLGEAAPGHRGCNRGTSWPPSLSLGR